MVIDDFPTLKLSELHGKQVTLFYGKDDYPGDRPWETLVARDSDGKLYVLVSKEVTE